MRFSEKTATPCISRFRSVAVAVFVVLNLAVFVVRAISIWRYGALFEVTGGESQMAYSIWKQLHHLPVYQNPLVYPYSLSLYNYLFYYTYAFFLKLVGVMGSGVLTWGRFFTLVFAVIGAVAQWKLVRHLLDLHGATSALSLLFAFGLWFCASIVRYWAITIRPDLPAVALVMIALCVIVLQPRYCFAYAGILFYLAWSFKQSIVLVFVGVCLYLLLRKQWRDLSVLVLIFAALTGLTLILGSSAYRYSILVAPRMVTEFSIRHALPPAARALLGNAYWVLAPAVLLLANSTRKADKVVRLLATAFAVALVGGLISMCKIGAWDNYLLEAFVAGSTLLQIAVFSLPGRLVSALLVFGCLQPAVQVATRPSGPEHHLFGTVGLATPAAYAQAVALEQRMTSMKKPVFSSEEIFALPWRSNNNRPPALIVDRIFHDALLGRYDKGGIEGMLQRGEIPTVLLRSDDSSYLKSLSPSYKKVGVAAYSEHLFTVYTFVPLSSPQIRR